MDFETIGRNIQANSYGSLEELEADFVLVCTNAMLYNARLDFGLIYVSNSGKLRFTSLRCGSSTRWAVYSREYAHLWSSKKKSINEPWKLQHRMCTRPTTRLSPVQQ